MSDLVKVPFGDNAGDTAVLLLDAAEKAGYGPEVVTVRAVSEGNAYEVPEDVAKAAKVDLYDEGPSQEERLEADDEAEAEAKVKHEDEVAGLQENQESEEKPARKATAKKAAAKKTAK